MDALRRAAPALTARCTDAALAGLLLLAISTVIVVLTLPAQAGPSSAVAVLAGGALVLALLPAVALLPWRSWHPLATLVMPVALMAGLTSLSLSSRSLEGPGSWGSAYIALYCMTFVHAGMWLSARASWWLLPFAVGSYPLLMGQWTPQVALRLVVTAAVWLVIGHLVAYLQARQHAAEGALRAATLRDALTRLDNRRGLDARLADLAGGDVVVMLDLDHFKVVNDTRGHAGGDAVLADLAGLLTRRLRAGDYAARYGGEEFLLILSATDPAGAGAFLQDLRRRWAEVQPEVTFSSGYAQHDAGDDAALTVEAADTALYRAKRAGRDQDAWAAQLSAVEPPAAGARAR